ncbi:MAG: hypothetical protein KTR23_00050 [Rhodospirillales bacterium]|nr:hypothetical protein [Rhodospirillales bacterium]
MTAIEKFTFSLSFDDADNVIRSSGGDDEHYELGKKKKKKKDDTPPPPPAVYTEEQATQMIAEAEQKGHAQGFAEGHEQGFEQGHKEVMASVEKAIGDVESVIAEKLDQIDEQQKRANAKINEDAIHVALGVIRKLAPAWSKQYELVEIEDIVRQCLANLFEAPKVLIKVHPDLEKELAAVSERIALSRGFSGKVVVVGEPDVVVGDCMVSWGDGTAVRDTARVWSEINNIIDNAISLHAKDHDLPNSDMGDLDLQDSRLDEPELLQTPETSDELADTAADPQTVQDIDEQTPQSTQPDLNEIDAASTISNQQTDDAPQPSAMMEPETAPSAPEQEAMQSQLDNGSKEGDGTDARNVQTSTNDAMPQPDKSLETPEDQEKAPAENLQPATELNQEATTDNADEVTMADNAAEHPAPPPDESGIPDQENVAAPEPQPADPAPESQRGQTDGAKQEMPVIPTEAEELAADKQPTKDAGDENG